MARGSDLGNPRTLQAIGLLGSVALCASAWMIMAQVVKGGTAEIALLMIAGAALLGVARPRWRDWPLVYLFAATLLFNVFLWAQVGLILLSLSAGR